MLSASLNKTFPSFLRRMLKSVLIHNKLYLIIVIPSLMSSRVGKDELLICTKTAANQCYPQCSPLSSTWFLCQCICRKEGRKEMFYLTTHSTHFIYGYMASDLWLRTILIVRKETRCRHIGYSFQLAARVLLYASSHRQDDTYHVLCYTSRGALAGMRNSSMGPPHEGSIQRPIAP